MAAAFSLRTALCLFMVLCCTGMATAQVPPGRDLWLIVPGDADPEAEFLAIEVAPVLAGVLGQPVRVAPRSRSAPLDAVAAPADGHAVLLGDMSLVTPAGAGTVTRGASRGLVPVARLANAPQVLIVHPSVRARSVAELLALARSRPGRLDYAAPPGASPAALGVEVLKQKAGLFIVGLARENAEAALAGTLSGEHSMMFASLARAREPVERDRVRALAVTLASRSPLLPGVPTFAEAGLPLPELEDGLWWGVFAPAGTAPASVERIERALRLAMFTPQLQATLGRQGLRIAYAGSAALGERIRVQTERWRRVVGASSLVLR